MSRAQLKHVLLDVSFKDKPKIIDLEIEFKPIARLLLMDILAACSAATNAEITHNVCKHLGNRIGIDAESVEKILDYCIQNEILWSVNGKITNSRVIKDQESYFNKLKNDRNRKDSKRIPNGNNTEKEKKQSGNRSDSDIDIDFDIDNDLNNNKLKLSGKFNTPEIKKAVSAWRDKLRKAGRIYDQIQLDANCINFNTPEKFLEALNFSLGLSKTNNLYAPPEKEPPKVNGFNKNHTVPASESKHPALIAERDRQAKAALEKLGMGGLAK